MQELELTRTTNLAPASPQVSEEVSLGVEDDSTITGTSTAKDDPVSDEVNLSVEDDITTRTANAAKIQHANIAKIVKEKDFRTLESFGGIKGIAEALDTDLHKGIPGDEQDLHYRRSASVVSTTQAPTPSFFKLLIQSCCDWTIFLLLVCAILSIGFGIQQEGPSNGWLEGAVGMFAINILVVVPTMRKYFSVPQTRSTSQIEVEVYRGGNLLNVSPSDVVPGDLVCLKLGSLVPADGLFVSTGELVLQDGMELSITVDGNNPFLVYGARVVHGNGRMLVTCVGMKTTLGELMEQVRCTPNQEKLPVQLDKLSTRLQNIGLLISILMTLVLITRSVVLKDNEYPGLQADQFKGKTTASEELINVIGKLFMKSSGQISVLMTYLPLLIVGLTEGVPFSVALAITYWTKTTLSGKATAQRMLACFTMGCVSTICIGGGLTLNPVLLEVDVNYDGNQIIDTESVAGIDKQVREALYKGISTPRLMPFSPCSSIEHRLLLTWAESNLGTKNGNLLQNCTIVRSEKLSTDEEASGVVIKDSETGDMCLYWNGPATTILPLCSHYYDSKGTTKLIDEQKKHDFNEVKENMQSKHLKTIAFAYKKIDVLPEEDNRLILIGLLGVKCCTETMEAEKVIRKAGVNIIHFSVSEGESPIYGGGRPLDILHRVQCLKDEGHVVAMVGGRTNDTPALKEAHVGIVMGACTSEMARECCDLIIDNGSFSFLITIILIGRCIHCNIRKYIQVGLTMNVSLLVTTSISTMFLGHCTVGAIQILWANILVTLSGLALLVEPPTEELMGKLPIKQTESLISKAMWRNILLQASYQAAILVSFQFKWKSLPGINEKVMESIVFNSYVLCQVFNQVSSREPEKKNVFRGILQTPCLSVAVGLSIILQVVFVEIAHKVAANARLNGAQWGVCLLMAMVSWAIDLAGKCVLGVIMEIRTPDSDIGSSSMKSFAVSESASNRELLD